jgi:hypothetical protein
VVLDLRDWLTIGEFPDEKAAASAILAAAGGGSLSDIETSERCGSYLRICRKGGEGIPERRALVGSGGDIQFELSAIPSWTLSIL